jgi:hypothetical protein
MMSVGTRARRRRAWSGALAVVALTSVTLSACGTAATTSPGQPAARDASLALATSIETSDGTWATIPMGHLDQPLNTFWQLFFRPGGTARWTNEVSSLAVATNGGLLIASPGGPQLAVGIRPSDLLSFSPVLVQPSHGQPWSPVAPVASLAAHPNALAVGAHGRALALSTSGQRGEVLASTPDMASWGVVTTGSALASSAPGRACVIGSLTAVGWAEGHVAVAAACRTAGVVGILVRSAGGWRLAGPKLPVAGTVTVRALVPTAVGLCALLTVSDASHTSLYAAWMVSPTAWRLSPALQIPSAQVLSVGPDGSSGTYVVLHRREAAVTSAFTIAGPGKSWSTLPAPPAHTVTLAFGPRGTLDALSADNTVFTDWTLARGSAHWTRIQTTTVPIEFGTSG